MNFSGVQAPSGGQEVIKLVQDLEEASKLPSRGKASKRICDISGSEKKVVSWKFQEWDYGKNNIHLPCNARGLFILEDDDKPEIVARGYDKFFNVDEVPSTKWDYIESHTSGPYDVTLKSNGCIIFISGLADGTLVVCSKHSTGARTDVDRNHAESGKAFLLKQLAEIEVDHRVFAKRLHELNVTAVAEYCDDSFEEHILEYVGDRAGLYLHGMNLNQPQFATWPMKDVDKFASQYNFKPTEHFQIQGVQELKIFLDECSRRGSYDGSEIEGFVIRCHLVESLEDYFFKFKFEEPYLMYRQWREVTKDYIATKSRVFRFRKHKFITNKYLDFVIPKLDADSQLCEQYVRGFGIIELRNAFLHNFGMTGMEILNYERVEELELRNAVNFDKVDENTKFLIFPVAVIGCGKTTTSLTLKNLYPDSWEVVQNDNITSKDKSMLMKRSLELLAKPEVRCVVVDRNNHQYRERKQLFSWLEELKEDFLPYDTNIKVIGLSFFPFEELDTVKKLTVSRVLARGDNHQSIKSSSYGEKKVLGIMQGFINRFQPVDVKKSPDNMFDLVIPLKVSSKNSSFKNATTVLKRLNNKYPVLVPNVPSTDEIEAAFIESLKYKPTITKVVRGSGGSEPKKSLPTFFSAHVVDRSVIIEEISNLIQGSKLDDAQSSGIERLFQEDRFQPEFHITLSHISQRKKGNDIQRATWQQLNLRYQKLISGLKIASGERQHISTTDVVKFTIKSLCWDEKVVGILVNLPEPFLFDADGKPVADITPCNEVSHITVGILKDGTPPFYTNELCQKVLSSAEKKDIHTLDFKNERTFEATVRITFQ